MSNDDNLFLFFQRQKKKKRDGGGGGVNACCFRRRKRILRPPRRIIDTQSSKVNNFSQTCLLFGKKTKEGTLLFERTLPKEHILFCSGEKKLKKKKKISVEKNLLLQVPLSSILDQATAV